MKGHAMSDAFLKLPTSEQAQILNAIAHELNKPPIVLEKDVWLCWTLQFLFTMPGRLPMAFKGGTALSKVYNAIQRFSEDIDITLDYRGFVDEIKSDISKAALKKLSDELKQSVANYSKTIVMPYFEKLLNEQFAGQSAKVEVSNDGEKVRIHYPSAFEKDPGRYMAANVLIEFGGRNITEPNEHHLIRPYAAASVPALQFPEANVSVLSLSRSFWEKATLIHVECNRREPRLTAERLSRHWYDLSCLYLHKGSKEAVADRELLADVIKYKKMFYNASYANYDACLNWALCLTPSYALLEALTKDFQSMISAGMFYDQPSFENVIENISKLEAAINTPR